MLVFCLYIVRKAYVSVRETKLLLNTFVVDGNFTFNSDVSSLNVRDLLFCNNYPRYTPVTVRPNNSAACWSIFAIVYRVSVMDIYINSGSLFLKWMSPSERHNLPGGKKPIMANLSSVHRLRDIHFLFVSL